ncbi:MAG: hypothetical protein ACYTEQ_16100 [Planctomycetota bacterium]|jgi:hypothetical protein
MRTEIETKQLFLQGIRDLLANLETDEGMLISCLPNLVQNWEIESLFYEPDESLASRVKEYNKWCEDAEGEEPGKLMEEIAYLAFRCLSGKNSIKSYQSFGPQIDLAITGSSPIWNKFVEYLHLTPTHRTIVVEAKNLGADTKSSGKVTDAQFSRLCHILQNHFSGTSALGVFVTRFGASGFPQANLAEQETSRQRVLRDAQATQIIFHARTSKYVVVLDHNDIQKLAEPGTLPRILEAKIRAVEEWTGLPVEFDHELQQVDLPAHLAQYVDAEPTNRENS